MKMKFVYKVLFFMLLSLSIAFAEDSSVEITYNKDDNSQQEIHELMGKISYLKEQVQNINTSKTSEIVLGGVSQDNFKSDIVFDDSQNIINSSLAQSVIDPLQVRSVDVAGEVPITSQGQETYIGSYSSENTIPIGRLSSNLFASSILNQRKKLDDYSLFFGGYLEVDPQVWAGTPIDTKGGGVAKENGQNIYLTTSTLYFISNIGHYTTAEFDFTTSGQNIFNVQDSFVMFGNLDSTPWFVTVGKYRLSTGTFGGGGPWTSGINTTMFRPNRVANIALNYNNGTNNFNFTAFNHKNHPSFSTAYFDAVSFAGAQTAFNVGYIYDIRGASSRFKDISTRVGEFNVDGTINLTNILPGSWNLQTGWATTTDKSTQFNGVSNSYTGSWYVATAYGLELFGKGQNINVSYGRSYNANKIAMPLSAGAGNIVSAYGILSQYIISTQRAYLDNNVLFGPEYSRQNLYNGQDMNTVTLDLSVYI